MDLKGQMLLPPTLVPRANHKELPLVQVVVGWVRTTQPDPYATRLSQEDRAMYACCERGTAARPRQE